MPHAVWAVCAVLIAGVVAQCPTGWTLAATEGLCIALSPLSPDRVHVESTARDLIQRRSYPAAQRHCARFGATLPVVTSAAALAAIDAVAGPTSGLSWWLFARREGSPLNVSGSPWLTIGGRPEGLFFDWDDGEPRDESECAVQWMRGDGADVLGGREKMRAVDCGTRHATICVRPLAVIAVQAADGGPVGSVEAVEGTSIVVNVYGAHLPVGTTATLQSTTDGRPAPCAAVASTVGESAPIAAIVTASPSPPAAVAALCLPLESCTAAAVNVSTAVLRRGAEYAVCLFASSYFAAPVVPAEFAIDTGVTIRVVQSVEAFDRDVCDRVALVEGLLDDPTAVEATPRVPTATPFSATVEGGREVAPL